MSEPAAAGSAGRRTGPAEAPVLRAATLDDLAAIEDLVVAGGLPLVGVARCVADGTAVVAVGAGGGVLGVAATERHGPSALLRSVAVDPAARGRGLGGALVARALADAREAGMREAWLLTETAASWFEAAGWTAVDRAIAPPDVATSVEFAIACPDTAVAMRRIL
jgi:N-acetylglutamate synthase-like GNAT family acetyltransferase